MEVKVLYDPPVLVHLYVISYPFYCMLKCLSSNRLSCTDSTEFIYSDKLKIRGSAVFHPGFTPVGALILQSYPVTNGNSDKEQSVHMIG